MSNVKKVLSPVNYSNKMYGLVRENIVNYSAITSVVHNYRVFIHKLGFDSSLLNDSEILGFGNLIYEAESSEDTEYLVQVLDFLV